MTKSQVTEISLAKMLLCVVLVFGICNIPAIIRAIIFAAPNNPELIRLSDAGRVEKYVPYTILRIVDWLCIAINSAVNFLIYCIMSRLFRKSLIDLAKSILSQVKSLFSGKASSAERPSTARSRTDSSGTIMESSIYSSTREIL